MTAPVSKSWPELAYEGWLLAGEMGTVIWLRSLRLMMGGKVAETEVRRMVSEKTMANLAFIPAMMAGGVSPSAEELASRAMAHYRKPVRANRRRLSR